MFKVVPNKKDRTSGKPVLLQKRPAEYTKEEFTGETNKRLKTDPMAMQNPYADQNQAQSGNFFINSIIINDFNPNRLN
jgi:hypothetical protein